MNRRTFIVGLSQLAAGLTTLALLACGKRETKTEDGVATPAQAKVEPKAPVPKRVFLTDDEAAVLGAALAVMLPEDQAGKLPSAAQVGVLEYIDSQLALPHFAGLERMMRSGLEFLDRTAKRDKQQGFAQLPTGDRTLILSDFQQGKVGGLRFPQARFFSQLHAFALEGYLGAPSHGGNRDKQTWHALGIDLNCHNMYERCG